MNKKSEFMKKYLCMFFFLPLFVFSQRKDIYITYKDSSVFRISKSQDQSIFLENYILSFNQTDKPHYKLSVTESGNISKNLVLVGSPRGSLFLTYMNKDKQNPPVVINAKDITNSITPNEILYSFETDIMSIINQFNNVYLVDMTIQNQTFYLAKKISVKRNSGL